MEIGNFSDWENGSIQNGVIRINAKKFTGAEKAKTIAKILAHEITHRMQETAPQAYEKYREFVLDILTENGTLEKTIQDYKNKIEQTRKENNLTKEQLPDLTDEEIMDEIAADYTTQFLKDTQLFRDFISKSKEHKKLGQRMIDAFKSVLAKIRKNISRSKLGDASQSDLAPAEKALQLWEQAYQSGQDIVEISPAQKSTGDGNTKKSINYNSAGVSWLLNDEIINKNQMAKFYEAVANISKRGYNYPRSKSGLYMVDLGNVIAFTDADFDNPQIYKAIEFFTKKESSLAEYKEWIYVDETRGGQHNAIKAIENVQGEGYVSEHIRKDYTPNAWKDRPGEGTDSSGTDTQDKIGRDSNRVKRSVSGTEDIIPTNAKRNEDLAVQFFGRTYSWKETGYLTRSGKKLDFSGRHEGGRGGYRSVDHRDIRDAIGEDYGGDSYSGAMVQFMREGNIRIMPESDGINLSVMPTEAQINALEDYISRARGEVILDLDDINGNTVSSTEYPRGTRASKVLSDIKTFFETGETPQISEVAKYRYSVSNTENILLKNLSAKEYNQLLHKKPIKSSKKDVAKVGEARVRSYANKQDVEIPILDVFLLAEYGELNKGHIYRIRNYSKDKFEIIGKTQIKPEKKYIVKEESALYERNIGREKTRKNDAPDGAGRGHDSGGTKRFGNRGELRKNDYQTEGNERTVTTGYSSGELDDSGTGLTRSLSNTESIVSENLEKARKQYGEIPKGENPARNVRVPRKSSEGQNVSYTIRTALEAGVTPDVLVPKIEEKLIQGDFSDETHTNKKTLSEARSWLEGFDSTEAAHNAWKKAVKDGSYLNEQTTVRGFMLYNQLATEAVFQIMILKT